MWKAFAIWFCSKIEAVSVRDLKEELANRDEVIIPSLRREIELLKRTEKMYALRLELEAKRIEAASQRVITDIAEQRIVEARHHGNGS